jgi:hypothetical protein
MKGNCEDILGMPVLNDACPAAQGVGFDSLTKRQMRLPIMAILIKPCWGFYFVFAFFFVRVCTKKLNPAM